MEFKEIASPTIKELFIQEIESMILSGRMPIGTAFPTERELATKMRISRSIVHQGMIELAAKGFVEITPRKGIVVCDYKQKGNMDTLIDILRFNGNRFDPETFGSMMEIRELFELRCSMLACQKATHENMLHAWELLEQLKEANNAAEWAETNFLLHHYISIISGNTIYPLIWQSFKKVSLMFLEDCYRILDNNINQQRTKEWLAAIEKHDCSEAEKVMIRILREGQQELKNFYFGQKIQED